MILWLIAGAVLVAALFLLVAQFAGLAGYPLDDAWIHQTYARNFARSGRWEYVPGVVSTGSTAPLWTLLLSAGYVVGAPHLLWSAALGAASLAAVAFAGTVLWWRLWPESGDGAWAVGAALVATWPLVWAAVSGMETLLFAALGVSLLALYARQVRRGALTPRGTAVLGVLGGLLLLTRPDGALLIAVVGTGIVLAGGRRWALPAAFGGAVALLVIPYFWFNWRASGLVWPSTLYAKQVEYGAVLAAPLVERLGRLAYFALGGPEFGWRGISGAHLVLLPGLAVAAWRAVAADWRARRLLLLAPLLWAGGHVLLYAWRLPVMYQHGRYLLPVLPVWVVYGMAGWTSLLARLSGEGAAWLARAVTRLTYAALLLVFLALGAQAYALDVAVIEGEMVATARWVRDNTPADALVAAHDIGALGYYAQRPLLDLAGLISPEVIPLLADPPAMAAYVEASAADFLVTAPGWPYPSLTAGRQPLFTTDFPLTKAQNLNNMAVYALAPSANVTNFLQVVSNK